MEEYIVQHSSSSAPPFIDATTVNKLLDMPSLLEALEQGLKNFSAGPSGGVVMPVRTVIPVGNESAVLCTMPAYSRCDEGLGVKLVSVFPNNAKIGLSSHCATVILLDSKTGEMLCLMDGGVITALRTAAVSALAIRTFSPTRSGKVAIIGSGVQARSHLLLLRHVFDVKEVRIFSRTAANAHKFASEVDEPVTVFDSAREAVEDADIIITTTMAMEPLVCGDWVKKGAVIAAVGACRPDARELDTQLMQSAAIIVDSRDGALKEAGDILLAKAEIRAEIGEVLGKDRAEFAKDGQTVVFENLGLAIEDVVAAKIVYEKFMAAK